PRALLSGPSASKGSPPGRSSVETGGWRDMARHLLIAKDRGPMTAAVEFGSRLWFVRVAVAGGGRKNAHGRSDRADEPAAGRGAGSGSGRSAALARGVVCRPPGPPAGAQAGLAAGRRGGRALEAVGYAAQARRARRQR